MRSIRRYLISRLLLALLILFGACGAALYLGARGVVVAQFDGALAAKARSLAALVEWEGGDRVEFEVVDEILTEFARAEEPEYYQLWVGEERVLERSRSLGGRDLPILGGGPDAPEFADLTLPDGRAGRAVGMTFVPRSDDDSDADRSGEDLRPQSAAAAPPLVHITVARERHSLDRALLALLVLFALFGVAVPVAVALIVGAVVQRGVRPVMDVPAAAERIGPQSLADRMQPECLPAELRPIAASLNAMLDRLEAGMERERRFRRDVAHELRTPIAELRTAAEVALRSPADAALHRQTVESALDIARQMERLTQTLLSLARLESTGVDAAPPPLALRDLDLGEEVRRCWDRVAGAAADKQLTVAFDFDAAPIIQSDPEMLAAALHILAENAVIHSPARSAVVWRIGDFPDGPRCSIRNAAPGLAPADLAHFAEPFWQKDPARTPSDHVGLGLALLVVYARALNVHVEPALDNGGLIMTLQFPPRT